MKKAFLMLIVGAALAGCSRRDDANSGSAGGSEGTNGVETNSAIAQTGSATASGTRQLENTANNLRDNEGETLTPMDQGNNASDVKITQAIRKSIVVEKGADGHSILARNIKIITADGVVTLRGIVRTEGEKLDIEDRAKKVPGVRKVDNQLEIAKR
jgi:osmotically-inducible protein OsmY